MPPNNQLDALFALGPLYGTLAAGLVILFRHRRGSPRATALAAVGILGFAGYTANFHFGWSSTLHWWRTAFQGDMVMAARAFSAFNGFTIGVCTLLLVAGVVTGRKDRTGSQSEYEDEN